MDPKKTLQLCDQAISDCELVDALEHHLDYIQWRERGGFEPDMWGTRGDTFARLCLQRIESQEAQS